MDNFLKRLFNASGPAPKPVDHFIEFALKKAEALKDPVSVLVEAARKGDNDAIKKFLDKHPDLINTPAQSSQWTALETAARRGNFDTVKLLLERGADLDKKIPNIYGARVGNTQRQSAIAFAHGDIVTLLAQWPRNKSGSKPGHGL